MRLRPPGLKASSAVVVASFGPELNQKNRFNKSKAFDRPPLIAVFLKGFRGQAVCTSGKPSVAETPA